jgi:leader peptidase (prepilin peptidase)/N-methyltransferase
MPPPLILASNPSIGTLSPASPVNLAFALLLGAIIGSFLNVVIARLPQQGASILRPRSHCNCGRPLAWYDIVPILSWFVLRGRARCCHAPISFRYPLVEGATALLFVLCALRLPTPVVPCAWLFVSGLIAIAFIDAEHTIIPDVLSLGLVVAGLVLSFFVPSLHGFGWIHFPSANIASGISGLSGMLIGSSFILWVGIFCSAFARKEALGFGDVKLLGAIGAFCGWRGALFASLGGAALGLISFAIARFVLVPSRDPKDPAEAIVPGHISLPIGTALPFGPMLTAAATAYLLIPHAWFDRLLPSF